HAGPDHDLVHALAPSDRALWRNHRRPQAAIERRVAGYGRPRRCATAADTASVTPRMKKMLAAPAAAASRPAMTGIVNWPTRLPIMRSELAVARSAPRSGR